MGAILANFGIALLLTEAVECGLAALLRSKRLVYAVFLVNIATNPVLNLILTLYVTFAGRHGLYLVIAAGEVVVVLVEAWLLKLMTGSSGRTAFLRSLLFNAASFGVGLLIFPL